MMFKDATVVVNPNKYTDRIKRAVEIVYQEYGIEPTCTSGNDSTKHKKGSMHYKDRALDFRTWDLLELLIVRKVKALLPPWYEVYIEKDHIHIEADERHEPEPQEI